MNDKDNMLETNRLKWSLFNALFALIVFLAFLAFLWLLRDLLTPVFLGLLLAFIFHPVITWANHHWQWPPRLTLAIMLLLLAAVTTLLAIWFVPLFVRQFIHLLQSLPDYIEQFMQLVTNEKIELSKDIRASLLDFSTESDRILPLLLRGTVRSFHIFASVYSTTTYLLLFLLLLLIFFITFSLHLHDIGAWLCQFLPHSQKEQILQTLKKISDAAGAFLRVRLFIALILGILLSTGWALAGVPYWLLFGIISGLLSIIPFAALLGWIAVLFVNGIEATQTGGLFFALLWPTVVYFAVELFEMWLLTPFLQGEELDIHPVIVLFVVLAGGAGAGLLGMLLAVPLTAAGRIIFNDLIKPRCLRWAKEH